MTLERYSLYREWHPYQSSDAKIFLLFFCYKNVYNFLPPEYAALDECPSRL